MTNEHGTGSQAGSAPGGPDPDTVREEAERLVATGLAAVSMVADRIGAPSRERGGSVAASYDALGDMLFGPSGHRRHNVANDSAECCRCPVCRVIAAAREPDPAVAERLATGVGNLAEGAARVLRNVAGAAGSAWDSRPQPPEPPEPPEPSVTGVMVADDPWAAATRPAEPGPAEPAPGVAPKPVTKKAVAKKAVKQAPAGKPAKQTVAKEPVANEPVAKEPVAEKPTATEPTGEGGQ